VLPDGDDVLNRDLTSRRSVRVQLARTAKSKSPASGRSGTHRTATDTGPGAGVGARRIYRAANLKRVVTDDIDRLVNHVRLAQ
jgi:hypothetical protein